MLVEFNRVVREEHDYDDDAEGEAEVTEAPRAVPIGINPVHVSAVFASSGASATSIIRLADGRGFKVHGTYQETMDKLQANGGLQQQH